MSVGKVLAGRYQLSSRLGAGGMGSVWHARDLTLDADVAIKLMSAELTGSAEATARFRREARAAAAIRSSHVVQILDYGVDGSTPFIAMELLRGESLADRLERTKQLLPAEVAHLLDHVARALALAHANGIVHRDLKPDNIFIVHEANTLIGKVLDFGIARRNEGLQESGGLATRTGAVLGTPYYMSPEQACAEPVDQLTDIWAFGVIACECLTGVRPFRGDSLGALFRAVCLAEMPVPSSLGPVPPGFDAWFARTAAREKAQRSTSVQRAAEELVAICSALSMPPTRTFASSSEPLPHDASTKPHSDSRTRVSGSAPPRSVTLGQTAPASSASVGPTPREKSRVGWFALAVPVTLALASFFVWRATLSNRTAPTTAATAPVVDRSPVHEPASAQPVRASEAAVAVNTAPPAVEVEPSTTVAAPIVSVAPAVSNAPVAAAAPLRSPAPSAWQARPQTNPKNAASRIESKPQNNPAPIVPASPSAAKKSGLRALIDDRE